MDKTTVMVTYRVNDCVGNMFANRCLYCFSANRKVLGDEGEINFYICANPDLPDSPRKIPHQFEYMTEGMLYPIPEWCPLKRVKEEGDGH